MATVRGAKSPGLAAGLLAIPVATFMNTAIILPRDQGLAGALPGHYMAAAVRGAKPPVLAAGFPASGMAALMDDAI